MAYAESEESIAYRVDLPSGPLIHLELQNTVAWPGGAERDRVKYAVQDLCGLLNGVGHIDGSYLNLAQVPAKSDKPNDYSPDEYMLGDAGLLCTPTAIAMFRRARGHADFDENLTFFNTQAAKVRVTVEQAFGIFKARLGILHSANTRMILAMNTTCILRNLLLRNWRLLLT
ncbi:uncharacterized protein L203_105945 [Cryptococcus depauperatus CBS 7841]|uniref:DDE Tnp4 domain-containing protein n=1 Tax=Cryptococcus depauperatus CBS 7841 TaxID=1295531 RepID=A0AAJ8M3Y8_9TREE